MKKQVLATFGVAALVALQIAQPVAAWGPERPTYTNKKPATHPVFNSITDNAAVGDERDFVRISEKGSGIAYSNNVEIEGGKQYEVYIYYHNNASETFNDKEHNYSGVARNVRLASGFPSKLVAGERGTVSAKITSTNTDPAMVWDEAYVTAKEDVTLHYVIGSAKIYNKWETNGSVLPMSLFTDTGTFLGLDELDGMILGCAPYSGQVVYTIQTETVEQPVPEPEPEPEPTPEEPEPEPEPETPETLETPKELPTTGPAEIVLAVVVVLAIVAGGFYWYRTKKAVRKVTRKAKGKK